LAALSLAKRFQEPNLSIGKTEEGGGKWREKFMGKGRRELIPCRY
jgi:hypothetical protein